MIILRKYTLTFTIGWLKQKLLLLLSDEVPHFNFHHRVVETFLYALFLGLHAALTFTIGWLKLKRL